MATEPPNRSDRPTPSEHVRLEADLATGSISESVWVNREATPHRPVVLVVEADPGLRAKAAAKLAAPAPGTSAPAFRVRSAQDAAHAAAVIEKEEIDLVLCGKLGTADDERRLNQLLLQDARFRRGARVRIAATHDTAAASVLREPSQARLLGEVLADLAESIRYRAPPTGEE